MKKKKKMIPLTYEKNKSYKKQKGCYLCKKAFNTDDDNKNYHKVRDHCHYTGKYRRSAHEISNLRYKTPKEVSIVFHNGSTYDYHFIIKELQKEFQGKFECFKKIQKNVLLFHFQLKKNLIMVKQSHTK